jgi:hypothetical protein
MQHYDIDGLPVSMEEWSNKYWNVNRRICYDHLHNPFTGKNLYISTVFIGLGTVMFETAVWSEDFPIDVIDTYQTMGQAWGKHLVYLHQYQNEYPLMILEDRVRHERISGIPEKPDFTVDT